MLHLRFPRLDQVFVLARDLTKFLSERLESFNSASLKPGRTKRETVRSNPPAGSGLSSAQTCSEMRIALVGAEPSWHPACRVSKHVAKCEFCQFRANPLAGSGASRPQTCSDSYFVGSGGFSGEPSRRIRRAEGPNKRVGKCWRWWAGALFLRALCFLNLSGHQGGLVVFKFCSVCSCCYPGWATGLLEIALHATRRQLSSSAKIRLRNLHALVFHPTI